MCWVQRAASRASPRPAPVIRASAQREPGECGGARRGGGSCASDSPPPSFALKIPEEPKRKYLTAVLQAAPAIPLVLQTEALRLKNQQLPPTRTPPPLCNFERKKKKIALKFAEFLRANKISIRRARAD